MKMMKLIKIYNKLIQQFEDWTFQYIVPPIFRIMLFGLKLTLFCAFYLTIRNVINDFM